MDLTKYSNDFLSFAADLLIPLGGGVGRFGDAMADFQRRDFAALAPSLHCLARGEVANVRRFWLERTKGASKDSDIAVCMLWLMSFSHRPLRIQVGAFDQQQADEIRQIVRQILACDAPLNRLLASVVDVQKNTILAHATRRSGPRASPGTGRPESSVEVLTTDHRGSHGSRPDLVLINELSHIANQEFAETIFDNSDKLPHSVVIIATNAGFLDTWQTSWREIARQSDRWHFSVRNTPAPWISADDLEESKRRNPPARYRRLWEGVWASGSGDALDLDDIEAACTQEGPLYCRSNQYDAFIGALDLGLKNDHSALVVIGIDVENRRYRLAECQSWAPPVKGGQISLDRVKEAVLDAHSRFGLMLCAFDPWQCALMAEQLSSEGLLMHETPFTPKNLDRMATTILQVFRNRQFDTHTDKALIRDLSKLTIVERQKGFKLEATRDEHGHADRATALAIALPIAEEVFHALRQQQAEPEVIEYIVT